jgi:hypothetical protein
MVTILSSSGGRLGREEDLCSRLQCCPEFTEGSASLATLRSSFCSLLSKCVVPILIGKLAEVEGSNTSGFCSLLSICEVYFDFGFTVVRVLDEKKIPTRRKKPVKKLKDF